MLRRLAMLPALLGSLAVWTGRAADEAPVSLAATAASAQPLAAASTSLASRVLVVYNANLQASLDVANYYAARRGIPASNLVGIRPSSTQGFLDNYRYSKALTEVVAPITSALTQLGQQQILYIVFTYGTPYGVWNDVWTYPSPASLAGASLDAYVCDPFGDAASGANIGASQGTKFFANPYSPGQAGTPLAVAGGINGQVNAIDVNNHPVVVTNIATYTPFESLASFRARTGKRIYSVFRLDGSNSTIAKAQVDKAIQAEQAGGLAAMSGKFYFDRKNPDSVLQTPPLTGAWIYDRWVEWTLFRTKQLTMNVSLPWQQENTYHRIGESASDIPSAPSAAYYAGTYGWYNTVSVSGAPQPDPWTWVSGAIGMEWKSEGLYGGPRGDNNPPSGTDPNVGWGVGAIAAGITATTGCITEPYDGGVPRPDAILRNLLEGANIGDAFFRDNWWVGWQQINVGDPLYTPFPGGRPPYGPGTGNQAPIVSLVTPNAGANYTAPATITLNATASDSDGTVARVDFFSGTTLLGSVTSAPYTLTWNNVSIGTYTLTASAVDNLGLASTSAPVTISVSGSVSLTPAPFVTSVVLGLPRNDFNGWLGIKFTVGASPITLTTLGRYVVSGNSTTHAVKLVNAATGLDVPNGSVSISLAGATANSFKYASLAAPLTLAASSAYLLVSQETYGGDQWGRDTTTVTTTPVATCNGPALSNGSGGWWVRTPVTPAFVPVNFQYVTNLPPIVALATPASGASFTAGAGVTLTANASDSDGTVNRVDFYAGTTLIGASTVGSPYTLVWPNVAVGNYTLTAVATDNAGLPTTSSAVNINVVPANVPPTVAITSPANGSSFTVGGSILLSANANDSDGTIQQVDFYLGGTRVGTTSTGNPYTITLPNPATGSYVLTAVATDNVGATTTSPTANFTVIPALTPYITGVVLGTLRNDFTGWMGMRITVGASPATVTALGRYKIAGNSAAHAVKMVLASTGADVSGSLTSVNLASAAAGQFAYTILAAPITLAANTTYYILTQELSGGDQWASFNTTATHTAIATLDGSVNLLSTGWIFRNTPNTTLGPVSFK